MSYRLIKIHVVNNLPYRKFRMINKARRIKYFYLKKRGGGQIGPLATKRKVKCFTKSSLMIS